ncbi:MAG: hypothetical protein COB45_02740 [Gammaproteobacteria bacterium]|nr:MAG: hypothetical protein COB45_02740 [Gammaproteobacteria bacterium]
MKINSPLDFSEDSVSFFYIDKIITLQVSITTCIISKKYMRHVFCLCVLLIRLNLEIILHPWSITMFKCNLMKNFLVAAALVVALPAAAQIDTWDLSNGVKSSNTTLFNSMTIDGLLNNNSLTITGWSDTGNGGTIASGQLKYDNSWGLQLVNDSEGVNDNPGHSIDSFDTYFDMVLLSFNEKVDLTRFNIGWAQEASNLSRADISVVAFTGTGTASFAGNTWGGIANSGDWSTIGEYRDVADYSYQDVTTDVKSKYWLVGAYNPIFQNPGETTGQYASGNNDGFKLASVNGITSAAVPQQSVPEPSSLAILGLGLLGFLSMRKKHS